MTQTVIPVILSGGSGTRLWPLSRRAYPKQFSPLFDGGSLFRRTLRRIAGRGYRAPLLLTSAEFRFIVAEQLSEEGLGATRIVIEPQPSIACAIPNLQERESPHATSTPIRSRDGSPLRPGSRESSDSCGWRRSGDCTGARGRSRRIAPCSTARSPGISAP